MERDVDTRQELYATTLLPHSNVIAGHRHPKRRIRPRRVVKRHDHFTAGRLSP